MARSLPQNLDAERALLGIIMDRNDMLFEVLGTVSKVDFFEPQHGEIFTLMRDMIETGKEAKPGTLIHDLAQDADIGGITASEYLRMMLRDAPPAAMATTFARTIRDLAMRRRFIDVAYKHLDEAFNAPATITAQEIESRYHAAASALFSTAQEAGMKPLSDLSAAVVKRTQEAYRKDKRLGLSSGLKAFDDLAGPLLGGRLYCLSGASGAGKTALAYQIARHVAKEAPVLFQSIEMDGEELATRDLSALSQLPGERIERADLNEAEVFALMEAQAQQTGLQLYVDSAKRPTVGSIRGKAMRLKRMKGLDLLVIDHLRYIKSPSRVDLFEQQTEILQDLNALADDLDVPVLLLVQLKAGYGSEATDWKKVRQPNVGDIFNGAVIEQESDVLMLVHRAEYMLARRKPTENIGDWEAALQKAKNRAELLLNKRRGGVGQGQRTVGWIPEEQRMTDEIPRVDFFQIS